MIDDLANNLALRLNNYTGNDKIHIDVVRYRLAEVLHVAVIFGVSLAISLFSGKAVEVIIILVAFGVLRKFSGGFHCKTLEGCEAFTITLAASISLIHTDYTITVNSAALLILILFTNKKDTRNRVFSVLLVASNFIIQSDAAAMSFLAQTLTLIRLKGGGHT